MNAQTLFLFGLTLAALPSAAGARFEVRLEAPAFDSPHAILAAPVPGDFPERGQLTSPHGSHPFQKNSRGEVVFIAPLKKGQSATWSVETGGTEDKITAGKAHGQITVQSGGKPIFVYQGEESDLPRPDIKPQFKRGGYLHPVYSPSGKIVTDDYPPNHIHHHGIWFPWTKTKFEGRAPDFWNMGQGSGKVEFVKLGSDWSGPVHAGFMAHHLFLDLSGDQPAPALNETWTVSGYAVPGASVFDLVSTQTCATASALELPKYHYGGLGFRGNWAWNGARNTRFLTSEGETDRVKGNETRGHWCYIGGEIDGGESGIVILSHPGNFRSPQPMRLHPSEPFFCFAPSQVGDWSIEPGRPYVSRYRFVVTDGPPDKEAFDRLWQQYAEPPKISIRQIESNRP